MFLRRVYIKKAGGELASEACYAAWRGFTYKAYPLDFFEWDDLTQRRLVLDQRTLVVGGTVAVHTALRQIGVEIPTPLNLPESLMAYAGRRVWTTTFGQVRQCQDFPLFVKPLLQTKTFAGSVLTCDQDLQSLRHLEDELAVQAAEPVVFLSEWRYFVHQQTVVGVAHYKGDWSVVPDSATVKLAVADYSTAPVAYALDFGFSSDGQTLIIEANDAFALGPYGLDAVVYATMLEDRWLELVGTNGT
jgi:hypothetical protein